MAVISSKEFAINQDKYYNLAVDEDVFIQTVPDAVIKATVEVTELMGSETYLYLTTSGKEGNIIARVNPRTTSRAGQDVQIAFDTNHLHFFDKETEITLLNR